MDLLTDGESRDSILDHPRLLERILEPGAPLTISPQFYFYILIRHVLKETGLNDRQVSDYVASLLEMFSRTARMKSPADGRSTPIQYVSDMLVALRNASAMQSFLIRAHMGNYALFITGIFHETVQSRAERGAPAVSFFEKVGSASYKVAAQHKVARNCALTGIYERLADSFHDVRLALNRVSDSLLHLDESPPSGLTGFSP
ncbi:MAG: hypothetical protein M3463_20880 [Verrucomicrobiota bacterium]|nr:hypothetical protein [Verrucomicrobiota bacterium]